MRQVYGEHDADDATGVGQGPPDHAVLLVLQVRERHRTGKGIMSTEPYAAIRFPDKPKWIVLGPWQEHDERTYGGSTKFRPHVAECEREEDARRIARALNQRDDLLEIAECAVKFFQGSCDTLAWNLLQECEKILKEEKQDVR